MKKPSERRSKGLGPSGGVGSYPIASGTPAALAHIQQPQADARRKSRTDITPSSVGPACEHVKRPAAA